MIPVPSRRAVVMTVGLLVGFTAINLAFDPASREWRPVSPWWLVAGALAVSLAVAYLGAAVVVPHAERRWKDTNQLTSLWSGVAACIAGAVNFGASRLFRAAVDHVAGDTSSWVWLAGNAIGCSVFFAALAALAPRDRSAPEPESRA